MQTFTFAAAGAMRRALFTAPLLHILPPRRRARHAARQRWRLLDARRRARHGTPLYMLIRSRAAARCHDKEVNGGCTTYATAQTCTRREDIVRCRQRQHDARAHYYVLVFILCACWQLREKSAVASRLARLLTMAPPQPRAALRDIQRPPDKSAAPRNRRHRVMIVSVRLPAVAMLAPPHCWRHSGHAAEGTKPPTDGIQIRENMMRYSEMYTRAGKMAAATPLLFTLASRRTRRGGVAYYSAARVRARASGVT